MKYGNRSLWQKIIASPLSVIVFAVLLAILARATWNIYNKANLSSAKLTQAQRELLQLQKRDSELLAKVGQLSTDQGIEAEIRTKYHAVKEGESVAVILDDGQTAGAANASSTAVTMGWWGRFWHFFGF